MKVRDCCLTIVLPDGLEEELVDELLGHPDWTGGFVISRAEGSGQTVRLQRAAEQVRGRAPQVVIQTVLNQVDARSLIAHLRETLPAGDVAYWISPVLEFGRLA